VVRERVTMLTIVGDSMGRPLVEELETEPGRYDTSSVLMLGSGGSILSADVKKRLLTGFPSVMALIEAIGSSESPSQALSVTAHGQEPHETLRFSAKEGTTIFDDQLRPVEPGSGVVGRLATTGRVPVGYYNDPEKSAQTFVTVDGVRWALPGDMAVLEADRSIRLLGRGSMCINTGGEKVYPEEVEAVLKGYDAIVDAVIVGTPDPRFGQRVAAVVEAAPGVAVPTLEEVQDYCRGRLAGHKVPRQLFVVDKVPRSPSGKPDYAWATEVARSGVGPA
jgi:3-oxocholest-4-en-26-oate---CoA ligase